jgi:universal stress protein E
MACREGPRRGYQVDKLTSILVVANRTDADRMLLEKAIRLARSIGAQIYLVSCDAALAKVLQHSYNSEDAQKAWDVCMSEHLSYLRTLRAAASAPDVQISIDAICHSPLHAGIVNKAMEIHPDLVMKAPSGAHPLRRFAFDANDWHLMRECPATVMLVREGAWGPKPKFGALIDVSSEDVARLAETIVHTSEYFALGCQGELDVVYSEASEDPVEREEHAAALQRLRREYHVPETHMHVLSGSPEVTLPDFAAHRHFDAIVLGGLTHRKGIGPLIGTLTSKLVAALGETDFILVKRGLRPSELPAANLKSGPSVAWSAMFGD